MNLKEAFRFQNALKSMLINCDEILGADSNVTKVHSTHLRKKVMSEAEDETVVEQAESEYADRINDVLGFMMYLLDQRSALAKAVREAKDKMPIDMDSEVGLNDARRHQVALPLRMVGEPITTGRATPTSVWEIWSTFPSDTSTKRRSEESSR